MCSAQSLVRLEGIRVVVFDLDDTLYAERSFAFSGFTAVSGWLAKRMDCPIDPAARMRELFETGDRRHIFDQLLSELGCPTPEAWLPAMIDCYRFHAPVISLDVEADRALKRWSGLFKLALISDGPLAMQQRKVDALGLADRLEQIILTDQWGPAYWKPHPRAFEAIEQTWGHRGKSCVYIADNVAKDFVAAHRLGWRTVWLRRAAGVYADASPGRGGLPENEATSLDSIDITS